MVGNTTTPAPTATAAPAAPTTAAPAVPDPLEAALAEYKRVSTAVGAENVKSFYETVGKDVGAKPEQNNEAAVRARELLSGQSLDLTIPVG
jgi:hypothetical protein